MFKNLGKIDYKVNSQKIKIDLDQINEGVNFTEEFIVFKKKDQLSIYDRICDHNSGKLISKDGKTFCPMHNWEFIPQTGVYKNGLVKKKKSLKFTTIKFQLLINNLNQKLNL